MKKTALASIFIVLTGVFPAHAMDSQTEAELSLAYTAAKLGKYADAILKTQPLIDQLKLDTVDAIILGNKILAVAYCEVGDLDKSKDNLQSLEAFVPGERFAEFDLSRACLEFFGLKKRLPKKASEPVASPVATPPPREPTPWQLSVPFGKGQFYNGDRDKAWAFLSTQAFGVVSMVTLFALFHAEKNADGSFGNTALAKGYKAGFWAAVGITSGAATWGIFDAHRAHRARRARQPVQAATQASITKSWSTSVNPGYIGSDNARR